MEITPLALKKPVAATLRLQGPKNQEFATSEAAAADLLTRTPEGWASHHLAIDHEGFIVS